MKYLLDTNIIIPLEPASKVDLEVNTPLALEFYRITSKQKHELFVHPLVECDLQRDKDAARAELRRTLLGRYQILQSPPVLDVRITSIVGTSPPGSNDWVDDHLLTSVERNAVDVLVTEDNDIHKKAQRLGVQSRVMRLAEVITALKDLFDDHPLPAPAVECVKVYSLDESDPIFSSFRAEYPKFDDWLVKCKREHRTAFIIKEKSKGLLAAICIINREDNNEFGLRGKTLKICTFKVSENYNGNRYGELLLKPVFDFLKENSFDHAFVTTFEKQQPLIEMFKSFGFLETPNRTRFGEMVLVKRLKYDESEKLALTPLEFNRLFGPWVAKFEGNSTFIVPIKPMYHTTLFPEYEEQEQLSFGLEPCGNSIKKAYLCNSTVRGLSAGDNLLFYRSEDLKAATVLAMVETVMRSKDVNELAAYVGKRTVYKYNQIEKMCQRSEVLAIKFRRVCFLEPSITLAGLLEGGCLKGPPQSVQKVNESGVKWLAQQIRM